MLLSCREVSGVCPDEGVPSAGARVTKREVGGLGFSELEVEGDVLNGGGRAALNNYISIQFNQSLNLRSQLVVCSFTARASETIYHLHTP